MQEIHQRLWKEVETNRGTLSWVAQRIIAKYDWAGPETKRPLPARRLARDRSEKVSSFSTISVCVLVFGYLGGVVSG